MTGIDDNSTNGDIKVYESDGVAGVTVRLEQGTVWLSKRQMAEVFRTSTDNVSLHLRNIYAEEELMENATTENFSVVQIEGNRKVKRTIRHYNLDAIISVGFRVNSKHAVRFRQWTTRILQDHLVYGFTLNERRIAERGLEEAYETLNLLIQTIRNLESSNESGQTVVELITSYSQTWRLLLEYDEDRLTAPLGTKSTTEALNYESAVSAIDLLRCDLARKGEASALFGNERGDSLKAILGSIEQSMFDQPLYRSSEEKAAHLLYFTVKDHPFTDGNKRIGAFLFMLYLRQEGISHRFDSPALIALTLLIAESKPTNKDLMVRLIVNLLGPDQSRSDWE